MTRLTFEMIKAATSRRGARPIFDARLTFFSGGLFYAATLAADRQVALDLWLMGTIALSFVAGLWHLIEVDGELSPFDAGITGLVNGVIATALAVSIFASGDKTSPLFYLCLGFFQMCGYMAPAMALACRRFIATMEWLPKSVVLWRFSCLALLLSIVIALSPILTVI